MSASVSTAAPETCPNCGVAYELRFNSLFSRKAMSFPCDSCGHVDMDALSGKALNNYLSARVLIGREYEWPRVLEVQHR